MLEDALTILLWEYLMIPDQTSRQINKQLSKIREADEGGAITIINKDDHVTDCSTLFDDNSTYHKMTTDMMVTHLKEAENLLSSITIANKQHVSKLLPTLPKPGICYALPKLHILNQLISYKYSHSHLINALINTEQMTKVANSLEIRPQYRTIASCKGTLTKYISGYVDSILLKFKKQNT